MSLVEGRVGLKWPPKINDSGGLDLTSPKNGGWETLRQVISVGHLPRMSSDPYSISLGLGCPVGAFIVADSKMPNELKKHIVEFYSRLEYNNRAKLINGPIIKVSEEATGKMEIHEGIVNLQSNETEEIVL